MLIGFDHNNYPSVLRDDTHADQKNSEKIDPQPPHPRNLAGFSLFRDGKKISEFSKLGPGKVPGVWGVPGIWGATFFSLPDHVLFSGNCSRVIIMIAPEGSWRPLPGDRSG